MPTSDYPTVGITAHREVTDIELHLTPGQANDLYNEVYALLRNRDIVTVDDRSRAALPAVYALYDALAVAGIDGTGPSAAPPFAQPVFTDGTPVPPTCGCGKLKAIDVGQGGQITLRGTVHRLGAPCYWQQP